MERVLYVLVTIGFAVSLYAFFVQRRARADNSYRPACDISERISCTRALGNRAAQLFPVHNTVLGLFFYPVLAMLVAYGLYVPALVLSGISVAVSVYLAGLLIRQRNFCVVCIAAYLINAAILFAVVSEALA